MLAAEAGSTNTPFATRHQVVRGEDFLVGRGQEAAVRLLLRFDGGVPRCR